MTLTVRLDPQLEREFEIACRIGRTSKSAVVTDLIRSYVRAKTAKSPFELAEEMGLVGCMDSAPATARNHSSYIKAKLKSTPRRKRERRAR